MPQYTEDVITSKKFITGNKEYYGKISFKTPPSSDFIPEENTLISITNYQNTLKFLSEYTTNVVRTIMEIDSKENKLLLRSEDGNPKIILNGKDGTITVNSENGEIKDEPLYVNGPEAYIVLSRMEPYKGNYSSFPLVRLYAKDTSGNASLNLGLCAQDGGKVPGNIVVWYDVNKCITIGGKVGDISFSDVSSGHVEISIRGLSQQIYDMQKTIDNMQKTIDNMQKTIGDKHIEVTRIKSGFSQEISVPDSQYVPVSSSNFLAQVALRDIGGGDGRCFVGISGYRHLEGDTEKDVLFPGPDSSPAYFSSASVLDKNITNLIILTYVDPRKYFEAIVTVFYL